MTSPFAPPGAALPPPSPPAPTPPAKGSAWKAALAGAVAGAVVAGGVAFATVQIVDDDDTASRPIAEQVAQPTLPPASGPSELDGDGLDIRSLLDRVSRSVVAIRIGQAAGSDVVDIGAGSGVIISGDGLVLTNAHVVEGADAIRVQLSDGEEVTADLVGSAPENDIALVRIRGGQDLQAAVLGDSDALQVGDEVVAIGNALNLGDTPTVTRGIVSAKNRTLEAGEARLEGLIQTDAAINRGNSGGPLLNAAGEVVGINSAGIPTGQNLGFAIAINAVKPLIEQLQNGEGSVQVRPFLGVSTVDIGELEAADLDRFGVTADQGAVVVTVQPGTAAEEAGLQVGDVITGIDGTPVVGSAELREQIQAKASGDEVTLAIERSGRAQEVRATLGSRAVAG